MEDFRIKTFCDFLTVANFVDGTSIGDGASFDNNKGECSKLQSECNANFNSFGIDIDNKLPNAGVDEDCDSCII